MRNLIFFFIFNCAALVLAAQNAESYSFHGIVNADSSPKENCTVKVFENDRLISYSKTLSNGYFNASLNYRKKYRIEFSFPGYENHTVSIGTDISQPKSKLSSDIYTVNLSKTTEAEHYFIISNNGKLSESKPFSHSSGITPKEEQILADANEKKLRAELKADSIVNAALRKRDELLAEIEKENQRTDSLAVRSGNSKILLTNDSVSSELIDNLSESEKKAISSKDSKIENILSKGTLSNEDSIQIIRTIIEKKELLLKNLNDRRSKAEANGDSLLVNELSAEISKLEPQLEIVRQQAKRYEKEIAMKDKEIAVQRRQLILVAGVLLMVFAFIIILAYFMRQRKKTNKKLNEQNLLLEQQKFEIHKQAEKLIEANAIVSENNVVLHKKNELIEHQNLQINKSINYAGTIQQAVLPADVLHKKHFDSFVFFSPKDIVSGDFYWFSELHDIPRPAEVDDMFMFAVADCTGHGVPGAFMSLISIQLLNQIVNEQHTLSPKDILEHLDAGIMKALKQTETGNTDGIDMGLIKIEHRTDKTIRLSFSGAKRPLVYFDHNSKEIKTVEGSRRPIGGNPKSKAKEKPFEEVEILLSIGDIVYMDSDGFTDQNDPKRQKLGRQTLNDTLLNIAELSMNEQYNKLKSLMQNHQNGEEQRDDITLIGIKFS